MKFRVKMLLEDSRKVYVSKRDKIDFYTSKEIKEVKKYDKNKLGVYLDDLGMYGGMEVFKEDVKVVRVIGMSVEDYYAPLDKEAFILGGIKCNENMLE